MEEEIIHEALDNRAYLVTLLKDYPTVLSKSMLPQIAIEKERSWKAMKESFLLNTGNEITVDQLKKLLYNMKTALKKKTDMKATGNKPIRLMSWEKDLLELLQADENPTFKKVPGSVSVGLKDICSNSGLPMENNDDVTELPVNEKQNVAKPVVKKRKLQSETDETASLTTSDLQRLLLLEQIKLTRLQIRREELLLTNESRRNDAATSGSIAGQAVFEIEENGQLKNLVIVNNVDSFKNIDLSE